MQDHPSSDRPQPGPDANLGYLFRLAHQRFRAALDEALSACGLTARQYGILSIFETRAELSAQEAARIAEVTRQTMHAAISALEAGGLIERRWLNRRVVLLRLTPTGRTCLERATPLVRSVESAAVADLSPEAERVVRGWLARNAELPAPTPIPAGGEPDSASRPGGKPVHGPPQR